VGKIRIEVSTTGVDEALQGESSDPFTFTGNPTYTGLRIPPVLNASISPSTVPPQPRYLFTLASFLFQGNVRLMGLRQGLTIGTDANKGAGVERPIEAWVKTPTFRFVDGNVSWHLVVERQPSQSRQLLTDTQNWRFRRSDSPAMLYETFTNTTVQPDGAPVQYNVGLTAYTPPATPRSGSWESVSGMSNMHDIRFPWENPDPWLCFGEQGLEVLGGGRLSLYASVLQSNPNTRGLPTLTPTALSAYACPEECFIQDFASTTGGEEPVALGVNYWRIMGALLIEQETE
jgi:hypothetical protein